jgi:hypothetical protein
MVEGGSTILFSVEKGQDGSDHFEGKPALFDGEACLTLTLGAFIVCSEVWYLTELSIFHRAVAQLAVTLFYDLSNCVTLVPDYYYYYSRC